MWAESPEIAEFHEHARSEMRREVTNEVKCKKITECATYDEFKEHVAAAFLKPVDIRRKPGASEATASTAHDSNIANLMAKEKTDDVCNKLAKELTDIDLSDVKCPQNAFEFEKDWRRACKSSQNKVRYLRKIPSKKYRKIFKVEGSLTVLGDIITALYKERRKEGIKGEDRVEYDEFLFATFRGLSRIRGISMAVAFLEDEVSMCKDLFRDLKQTAKCSDVDYTEEDVDTLEATFVEEDENDDDDD
mmetsp:Transcript_21331/g.29881  ORF Transcript_21331/g.29881 Transcript_21331/m.29881 type:complete len:247 (-) Transcript_21331:128-868(-)|eukprot:CAMPEP_0185252006 /NCGR_PEP_ID=MMETSP1359-20130426/1257_1 /TAXON_ID=552665 /ORGANISM="Bigelowiella longifila, Strain CCMP242" /LENGTH=246 /DNA_ID=CAMNT_0027834083 /DNA_START=28 /DNA_END=768 /DNA_ORIENTATION=-